MKALANYYREIEYVCLSELPAAQQELLLKNKETDFIKILIDGKVVGPCLQYRHYEEWYSQTFSKTVNEEQNIQTVPAKKLAWQNS